MALGVLPVRLAPLAGRDGLLQPPAPHPGAVRKPVPGLSGRTRKGQGMTHIVLDDRGWDWLQVDEEPWTPTDPPGFSMTGGDVVVLGAIVVAAWGAVIAFVLLVRRIWR